MFSAKDPDEIITLTFDFTNITSAVSNPVLSITVVEGTDPTPAAMLSGAAQIVGAKVLQKITGGVSSVRYDIRCQIDSPDGNRYVLADVLPIIRV